MMATRKLGRGRIDTDLRTRMEGEGGIVLPHHELEMRPLTYWEKADLHHIAGIHHRDIPRAAYFCIHCGDMWLHRDKRKAEGETCQRR